MTVIHAFAGEWDFLSNYHAAPAPLDGEVYPSVEHAYQAAKTEDADWRKQIRKASDPEEAKRLGRASPHRADWDQVKLPLMRELVGAKFRDAVLGERLHGDQLRTWLTSQDRKGQEQ